MKLQVLTNEDYQPTLRRGHLAGFKLRQKLERMTGLKNRARLSDRMRRRLETVTAEDLECYETSL